MKKRLKRILALSLLFTLIFTFTIKPKQSEAVVTELTIAGLVASGMALPAALIAIAGAAAIGGLIGTNMDGIKEFGGNVWDDLTNKGINPNSLVDEQNKTVTMSPELVNSAAKAVDTSTISKKMVSAGYMKIADVHKNANEWQGVFTALAAPIVIKSGEEIAFWSASGVITTYQNSYLQFRYSDGSTDSINKDVIDGSFVRYQTDSRSYGKTITHINVQSITSTSDYYYGTDSTSVYQAETLTNSAYLPETTVPAPAVQSVGDNVYQRELYANSLLAQNQVMQLDENMDYANSTLEDVLSAQNSTFDETKTQTGILSNIWSIIKAIPTNIAAAGVAASTAINTKMTDLWEDAGAIWTGMSDSLINIKADVNSKIGAMQTAMSGGIDNIRTDIGTMMDNLRAGIDSFAASAAANWASWGQLTIDGIDAGVGAITSGLTNTWTNVTTAITDGVGALNTEIGKIVTFITDLPTTLLRLIVPAEGTFSFKEKMAELARLLEQKFGSLDDLHAALGAMITPSGSIYQIEVSLLGRQYKIVPIFLKPTIDAARPFLTAALNLTSITFLIHRNKKELFK